MRGTNYYNLFEMSPMPMWVFDVKSLFFLDVNIAAIKLYGYTKAQFLGMTINDIRPEGDVAAIKKIVVENAKTGSFYKNTFRHIKKDGQLMFVNIESNPIDFEGHQARLVLISDITEKLKAEYDLLLSEQRLEALIQDGSDMIAIMDIDLNYLWVSPASLQLLGVSPEILIGHNAFEFIHREDQKTVLSEAAKLDSVFHIRFSPFRFKNLKGEWRWIETRATNLINNKAVGGIVCHSKDITENRNHILEIEEQNKKLRDIGWMQSHLVRSPVCRIMSLVDLLKNQTLDDEQMVLINYLSKSAVELDEVITNITKNASRGMD